MRRARYSSLWSTILLIWAGSEFLFAQEAEQASPRKPNPDVDAIIAGYRANRERFPFGRVKIVKTEGFAQSAEDALARQWLDDTWARQLWPEFPPNRSERIWFFDGETSRCEDTESEVPELSKNGSALFVRNKHFEILRFAKTKVNAVIRLRPRYDQFEHPFLSGLGMCEFAENDNVEFEGECEVNGRKALALATSNVLSAGQLLNRYWVDPSRGFLPVRNEHPHPPSEDATISVYEEFIQSSGDGWMPSRWVETHHTQKSELPWLVTDYEVTEWNFDEPPGNELFCMSVETGEKFSYERETFRVLGTEIDLRWFREDGSIDAPAGTIEIIEPETRPVGDVQEYLQNRYPPQMWELAVVLTVSIATGFGCLFLWDLIRRRRIAKSILN